MNNQKILRAYEKISEAKALILLVLCVLVGGGSPSPVLAGGLKTGDIVFASNADEQWNLWAVEPDTGYLRQLTSTTETERFPAVSPGGKKIAFVSGRKQIWVMDSLTGKRESVRLPIGIYAQPAWAPSGEALAFVEYTAVPADASEIYIAQRKHGFWQVPEKITHFPPMMTYPCYSPDGKLLACASFERDRMLGVIEEIVVMNLESREQKQLTNERADSYFPVWSPDGKWLAYASNLEGNFDIWTVSYPGGEKKRLTSNAAYDGEPSWSPDGKRVAFISSRSGHREIWTVDANGHDSQQVTRFNNTCSHPFWVK